MKRCLKISFDVGPAPPNFLSFLQNCARELGIEGVAQVDETQVITITICGNNNAVEGFLDYIHAGYQEWFPANIVEEPFLSNRDYRGTFRIIE
jgi:acylphosphatase